jgi:predicted GNAT family acetyltransferase
MQVNLGDVIVHDEAARRYEACMNGRLPVITDQRSEGRIVFVHTGAPSALAGHGIAGKMVRVALEDARAQDRGVIPRCPFVAAYIRRHPVYAVLVPPEERTRPEMRHPHPSGPDGGKR